MLPTLLLAAATALPLATDVRVENGVRVHRMAPAPAADASAEPPLRVRIDPGYRGTELYTPSRIEMRFPNGVPILYVVGRPTPFGRF